MNSRFNLFQPVDILQTGSIIHPGALNKKAGLKWPIFPVHQQMLTEILPVLIETHHAVVNYQNNLHNTKTFIGFAISEELFEMVNLESIYFLNKSN